MPSMFHRGTKQTKGGAYQVRITHLDNTFLDYRFDKSTTGSECLLYAASTFKISQHHYFSLKFKSLRGRRRWLYMNKAIKKQLEKYSLDGMTDWSLTLEIKFFPISVHLIEDEVTRYLFYLQLKMDILDGCLPCTADEAIKLAAYSVQAECGDYDENKHSLTQLRELNLLPERHCNIGELNNLLTEISNNHKLHQGLGPSLAEQSYLKITQSLSEYGQEGFEVVDDAGDKLSIGACAAGIFVKNFIGKPPLYMKWEELRRVTCKDKYFGVESRKDKETILFNTTDVDIAKYIMWCISEQNQFFLKQSQEVVSMRETPPPTSRRMYSSASEEFLNMDRVRTCDVSPASSPLQHASSTLSFPTNYANTVLSRYHSDHNMNFPGRDTSPKKQSQLDIFASKQTHHDYSPIRRADVSINSTYQKRPPRMEKRYPGSSGKNSADDQPHTPIKQSTRIPIVSMSSPVPVLLGFRRLSCEELPQTSNDSQYSLPSSQRSSGSFNHISFTSSPVQDTSPSDNGMSRPLPSPCNVIYERDEFSTRNTHPLSKRNSKTNNPINNSNHTQVSKSTSVPFIDIINSSPVKTNKDSSGTTNIPSRRHSQQDGELGKTSDTEITKNYSNTLPSQKRTQTNILNDIHPADNYKPPDTKLSLPRRTSSLAQRSIPDDPVKYYKFLASLFKRKHESWCTDEFSHIKVEKQSTSHAKKPDNINKNRNRSILPYNSTRVKLNVMNNVEASDYINASHVVYIIKSQNYHFIAAQSPMAHTCTNFWQMIWEEDVRVITMLNEGNKDDVHPSHIYFPSSSTPTIDDYLQFDQYKISLRSYQDKGSFIFRQFSLKHIPSGKSKEICHLQFLEWIDEDSPKSYDGFQSYLDYIKGIITQHKSPLLVHCNLGIGPSGVFMLVYLLQEHIKLQEILHVQNVLGILCSQRMDIIATQGQFKFVYFAMYKYTQYLLTMEERHTLI
ncbi:Tyrosine-protein phosphatase non-receptor type 14-like [Oopsacas minuta]|uniref:protein-tyrosine-phosphatase n=1 Tax=Oopsacas minuta TaxID=111878 RepID=A0AAV7KHD7_9METZ|nr:Tyrosine-protein phosphatase non-receptor type 14-like [Oopsacas minuta]